MLASAVVHCDVAISAMTVIMCYTMLAVIWSLCMMMHGWSVVLYYGLMHVSIV